VSGDGLRRPNALGVTARLPVAERCRVRGDSTISLKKALAVPNRYLTMSLSSGSRLLGLEAQGERMVVGRLDPCGRSPVTDRSSLGSSQPNIVPIRALPPVLDPAFHQAHELVDRVPRQRLLGLLPMLRRAAEGAPMRAGRPELVGEKNLPSATGPEPPTPGMVGAAGPD
jgi:hypothetical protein